MNIEHCRGAVDHAAAAARLDRKEIKDPSRVDTIKVPAYIGSHGA